MQWWTATAPSRAGAELLGTGDVDAEALDEGVLRSAARAGQEPHLLAALGQLLRDGRADGTGSGDDVDGVHVLLLGIGRALLSVRPA